MLGKKEKKNSPGFSSLKKFRYFLALSLSIRSIFESVRSSSIYNIVSCFFLLTVITKHPVWNLMVML